MAQQNETPIIFRSFLDYETDVKPFLGIPSADESRAFQIRLVADGVCDWVQQELGKPIAPTQVFKRFNGYSGWGGQHLSLPYYPVLRDPPYFISVVEYWGTGGGNTQQDSCTTTASSAVVQDASAVPPYVGATVTGTGISPGTTILSVQPLESFTLSQPATASGTVTLSIACRGHVLTEQTPTNQGASDAFSLAPLEGVVTRVFPGLIPRPFFPSFRGVEVTWWAGYNPIPPSLRLACLEAVQWYWDNLIEAAKRIRPMGGGFESPGAGSPEFWGSVLPSMLGPVLSNFASVGIG